MTTVLQVADSVTAQLNAAEFDFEFIAERMYVPNFDLEDMKELRVTVVPRDVELFLTTAPTTNTTAALMLRCRRSFQREPMRRSIRLLILWRRLPTSFV